MPRSDPVSAKGWRQVLLDDGRLLCSSKIKELHVGQRLPSDESSCQYRLLNPSWLKRQDQRDPEPLASLTEIAQTADIDNPFILFVSVPGLEPSVVFESPKVCIGSTD